MNISTTNVNFNGKKEVIYGLKKAAQEAKNIETARSLGFGPRPIRRESDIYTAEGKMNAYLDMAVNDSDFSKTIEELITKKDPINKSFKETLQKKPVQFGEVNPMAIFTYGIRDAAKYATEQGKEAVDKFLNFIKM